MKKILFILVIVFFSCTPNETETVEMSKPICYKIESVETSSLGDFVKIQTSTGIKTFKVENYRDYLVKYQICEPINLKEVK